MKHLHLLLSLLLLAPNTYAAKTECKPPSAEIDPSKFKCYAQFNGGSIRESIKIQEMETIGDRLRKSKFRGSFVAVGHLPGEETGGFHEAQQVFVLELDGFSAEIRFPAKGPHNSIKNPNGVEISCFAED